MKIETERLILREWKEEDVVPFTTLNQDKEVMRYFPSLLTETEVRSFIERSERDIRMLGYGWLAVERKEDGTFLGFIGLNNPAIETHFTPCTEIGWRIAREYWGNGYATEGARAVLDYAFNVLKLKEVVALTTVGNARSRNVMERLGMKRKEADDFDHPLLKEGHPLRRHVLYRLNIGDVPDLNVSGKDKRAP